MIYVGLHGGSGRLHHRVVQVQVIGCICITYLICHRSVAVTQTNGLSIRRSGRMILTDFMVAAKEKRDTRDTHQEGTV